MWKGCLNGCQLPCQCHPVSLTLLLLPGFVADGRPQVDLAPLLGGAVTAAHHHAQAGFLEDAGVVVIRVAHRPAAQVPLCAPVLRAVDVLHVGVWPLLEPVGPLHVLIEAQRAPLGEPEHSVAPGCTLTDVRDGWAIGN